jgi:deoxyribose-phosphate aldolase
MSVDRERLVDLITGRVMEELRRSAAAAGNPAPAPPISPPAPVSSADGDAETQDRMRLFNVTGARTPEETRTLHEAGASRVGTTMGYCPASDGLANLIDHTLLKPDAAKGEIELLCREALQFCFASVCVNPNWVPLCAELLRGSGVKVCTVIGFPFGSHLPDVKAYEARRAVEQGANEVDMVINIGALKSKDYAWSSRTCVASCRRSARTPSSK